MVERHANTIGHALLGRNGWYVGANHLIIGVGPGERAVGEIQRCWVLDKLVKGEVGGKR
jgi:hypothetical protein